jgi:3-oxoacyl-[acyl-carrier-protein] synthase-3
MRLAALACYVPEQRIDAEKIICSAGGGRGEARIFTKLFGIEQIAAADPDDSLEEWFSPTLHRIAGSAQVQSADTLIYVHGVPIQHESTRSLLRALCQSHNLLANVRLVYEIDQNNCAGLFWGIQMARNLLSADLARCVAILAGDSLSKLPLSHRYVPGCTLIGDAFATFLLDKHSGGLQIGEIVLTHRSEFAFGLYGSELEMGRFYRAHDEMVSAALDAVGYPLNGNEELLPHNVNKLIWMQFCRRRGVALDRIRLDLMPCIGHCYTVDPMLLLERLLTDGRPAAESVTLLSTGLGAYTGACRIHFLGRDFHAHCRHSHLD